MRGDVRIGAGHLHHTRQSGGPLAAEGDRRPLRPWTYELDAAIEIGDGSFLNGTQFGCAKTIVVARR